MLQLVRTFERPALHRLAGLLVAATLATGLAVAARPAAVDCPVPRLGLAGIATSPTGMQAMVYDDTHSYTVVGVGDWIGGALVVHIDADSITLAPNARCTVRYQ